MEMEWIYLSPHLDDVALSCGGLVWEQSEFGDRTQVWTICAGDPPEHSISSFAESLHSRWQADRQATAQRRLEDQLSCGIMGAETRHFNLPDCIYRLGPPGTHQEGLALYDSEESLWDLPHPAEANLIKNLGDELRAELPEQAEIVCPLSLGGHVDHRITRQAVESLGFRLWYYPDYPYALKSQNELHALEREGLQSCVFTISERGLQAWINAVAAHQSQISTFWSIDTHRQVPAIQAMKEAIRSYYEMMGGVSLWKKQN